MSRTGINITKRKDGRWEARVIYAYDENHKAKYRYLYGKTYAEAKEKKERMQSEIRNNNYYITKNNLKLRDLCEQYLIYKRTTIKESTWVHYRDLIFTHICPLFECKLSDLKSTTVDIYAQRLLTSGKRNGKPLSKKSVRDILSLLKSIFKYAIVQNYMTADILNFSLPRIPIVKTNILGNDEQTLIEKFSLQGEDSYKAGILIALYTGLRIGELCALQWSDIDFEQSEMHINKTIQRIRSSEKSKTKIVIAEPKTITSIRTIPIPKFLLSILTAQKLKATCETAYVLTGTQKYIEPSNYYMKYTRWLRKLGIKHYSFHSLRHTFATRCVESAFDIKALSEILGHTDVRITLNRYVHPSNKIKREYMDRLSPIYLKSKSLSYNQDT